jgi:hypothetical protein
MERLLPSSMSSITAGVGHGFGTAWRTRAVQPVSEAGVVRQPTAIEAKSGRVTSE